MAKIGDKVQVLYAFEGIADNHELVLNEHDVVTITNADVGEGWWEGQNANGEIGLFPSGYVEVMGDVEQDANENTGNAENIAYSTINVQGQQDPFDAVSSQAYDVDAGQVQEEYDGGDDDWEDSWGVQNCPTQPSNTTQQSQAVPASLIVQSTNTAVGKPDSDSPKKTGKGSWIGGINLFSSFTISPTESFIMGESKADTSGKPRIHIILTEDGPMWENSPMHFSCTVSNPQKASKFSGLKSYITYNITPTHNNKTVSRRYKHFDWLLEQLSRKFNVVIAIPPLPDKQLTGRYEDEFIETRMNQLQGWIARMCLHPVVSQSQVFQHFLVSKDNEKAWKEGKRKAEHDTAVAGAFCTTIESVSERLDLSGAEQTLLHYSQFTKSMDEALKQTISHGSEYSRKCAGPLMREYQKMGQCFTALGSSFSLDKRPASTPLTEALKHTGQSYEAIGKLYQNQPKYDWNPLLDGFSEYKGIMGCFPNILANNKIAIDKQREMARLQAEGKYTSEDVESAKIRAETLSYAVQAEINHMQYYRVGDFGAYMKRFVEQQITFYQTIVSQLQETASMYEGFDS